MRRLHLFIFFLFSISTGLTQTKTAVLPSTPQVQWANAGIGAMFHFDVTNYVPEYNWRQWGTHPPASVFNPTKLNTDQWIQSAKAAGAKYAVLVAKHCSGFSLWPTSAHEYSVKNCPWKNGKGDIVADFIASCKKYGIRPGIYASAAANGFFYVDNPGTVQPGAPVSQQEYNAIVMKQLSELWGNYGKLFEIWFDGGILPVNAGGPPIAPLLKKLQPNAIVFQGPADAKNLIRWIGNEDGLAPYPNWSTAKTVIEANGTFKPEDASGDPAGKIWCPGETDFPLRTGWQGGWFWKADDQQLLTLDQLVKNYNTSVGRNSNMLIGIVVDTSGLVPETDIKILRAFGDEIKKRYSKPVATAKGTGDIIELTIGKTPQLINCVMLSENIAKGENIRKYIIEAMVNNEWKTVAGGTSVGHKRIQSFDPVTTNKIRVNIIAAAGKSDVSVSVFNISTMSP